MEYFWNQFKNRLNLFNSSSYNLLTFNIEILKFVFLIQTFDAMISNKFYRHRPNNVKPQNKKSTTNQ